MRPVQAQVATGAGLLAGPLTLHPYGEGGTGERSSRRERQRGWGAGGVERKKPRVPMEAVAARRCSTRTLEIRRGYQKPEGLGGGGGSCSGKASWALRPNLSCELKCPALISRKRRHLQPPEEIPGEAAVRKPESAHWRPCPKIGSVPGQTGRGLSQKPRS